MNGDTWIFLALCGALLVFLLMASFLSKSYSLDRIKSKTVGDGQHGTARWATPKEIGKTYHTVPFRPRRWRKGKELPTEQGLILGSVGGRKRKGKAGFLEIGLCSIIFQAKITPFPKPFGAFLGSNPAFCVVPVDAVTNHEPPKPRFLRGGDGDGHVAQLRETSLEQADGVDGGKLRLMGQSSEHFRFHRAVGDLVQVIQGLFVRKHQLPQFFSLQYAVFHGAGESFFDGPKQCGVGAQ